MLARTTKWYCLCIEQWSEFLRNGHIRRIYNFYFEPCFYVKFKTILFICWTWKNNYVYVPTFMTKLTSCKNKLFNRVFLFYFANPLCNFPILQHNLSRGNGLHFENRCCILCISRLHRPPISIVYNYIMETTVNDNFWRDSIIETALITLDNL